MTTDSSANSRASGKVALGALGLLGLLVIGFTAVQREVGPGPVAQPGATPAARASGERPGAGARAKEGGQASDPGSPKGAAANDPAAALLGREARDPTRPMFGGAPFSPPEPPATAALAARAAEPALPRCPAGGDRARASGQCATTLERNGRQVSVQVRGEVWLDDEGTLHIEQGTATVYNLAADRMLMVTDFRGRTFHIQPLGKVDIDEPPTPATAIPPGEVRPALPTDQAGLPAGSQPGPMVPPPSVSPLPPMVPQPEDQP